MAKFLVLAIKPYEFKSGDGEKVSGMNVQYINPFEKFEEESIEGFPVYTARLDKDKQRHFNTVPGFYDLDFSMRPGAKGKAELSLKSASFAGAVEFMEA